jgi:hypothetical protein
MIANALIANKPKIVRENITSQGARSVRDARLAGFLTS